MRRNRRKVRPAPHIVRAEEGAIKSDRDVHPCRAGIQPSIAPREISGVVKVNVRNRGHRREYALDFVLGLLRMDPMPCAAVRDRPSQCPGGTKLPRIAMNRRVNAADTGEDRWPGVGLRIIRQYPHDIGARSTAETTARNQVRACRLRRESDQRIVSNAAVIVGEQLSALGRIESQLRVEQCAVPCSRPLHCNLVLDALRQTDRIPIAFAGEAHLSTDNLP